MGKVFDIYGCYVDDLEFARKLVEGALGLTLSAHESSYLGKYYRWGESYGEEIILQKNFDERENEFREEKFKQVNILLYVNQPTNPEKIQEALASAKNQIALLEHKET